MRKFNRKNDEMRQIIVEKDYIKNSDGSCLISFGDTKVICSANFEPAVPKWLKNSDSGWITAEYSMLPGSTSTRNKRESKAGKQNGRTTEIQRLIGRSLRSIANLKKLQGSQIILDCDVIQADGGTRTTSINGSFIALSLAIENLNKKGIIKGNPIVKSVASVSCGIVDKQILLDLD